jgi:hypothetical protein
VPIDHCQFLAGGAALSDAAGQEFVAQAFVRVWVAGMGPAAG